MWKTLCAVAVVWVVLGVGCRATPPPEPSPTALAVRPTIAPTLPATPTATPSPLPTATLTPPPSPTPSPTPSPSPTPDPLAPFFIETLRARTYEGGTIELTALLAQTDAFDRYLIRYPSDGLTITGYANIPHGEGPFPVIVLNHGYFDPAIYQTGYGTLRAADALARAGFLTIAPDYRNYAGSDEGPNDFRMGYVVDVLNLLASVPSLPQADASRVGVWGHSMGGGITINVMVIRPEWVDAVVLYGAMSGDMADNWRHIHRMWNRPEMERLAAQYGSPDERPDAYRKMSAIEYLEWVQAPVQIHHGTFDEQVPFAWSERLRDALVAAGKEVEFYAYPGAPHNFQGETWDLFMTRVLAFFDEHVR
ncbi:alpha/beta hydrolase family protein [Ardenticatena maritima]|uniref:alpha/beta hydrolase family protein n=2 Tax=Ardenticatena maritima TaxID=872965 RepID=UPI000761E078|nr:alpha/beta fold hydrolase [Ardenticatena maritima]